MLQTPKKMTKNLYRMMAPELVGEQALATPFLLISSHLIGFQKNPS
jgi:hypothetical protein